MIIAGLMSGTSMDGVDAVAVDIVKRRGRHAITFLQRTHTPYPPKLRDRLHRLCLQEGSVADVAELNVRVGQVFGRAAKKIIAASGKKGKEIELIGSHGQTVWHAPDKRATLQIGDPAVIAAMAGLPVWADFRSTDMARGGEGAPLAPLIHLPLFGRSDKDVVVVNIGGIANLTYIPKGSADLSSVIAYDTGPGATLIDLACRKLGVRPGYDKKGQGARGGEADEKILDTLLAHSWFRRRPPKSTGRELFNESFLLAAGVSFKGVSFNDHSANILRTLTELTARSIAREISTIARLRKEAPLVVVAGGGANNCFLVERIGHHSGCQTLVSDALDVPATWLEGGLIALLAYYAEKKIAVDTGPITGAKGGAEIHGARYPGSKGLS